MPSFFLFPQIKLPVFIMSHHGTLEGWGFFPAVLNPFFIVIQHIPKVCQIHNNYYLNKSCQKTTELAGPVKTVNDSHKWWIILSHRLGLSEHFLNTLYVSFW